MSDFPPFAEFFEAVHGFGPFPWQVALADRVVGGEWPSDIDVPTGLGKTSVIDIAVYRLARDLAEPKTARTAHIRIALVVDRRLIVDAAHGHVGRLIDELEAPESTATTAVARALLRAGGDTALQARRMRGGLTWSSRWVRSPAQPVVLLGTVDQLGSRLLFRGYGTSDRMRPIDAGLLGSDTLILLDEAHLSQAFAETAASVTRIQAASESSPIADRPTTVVQMTATPSASSETLIGADDLDHPVAARRLSAVKNTVLLDVPSATSPTKAVDDAGDALANVALSAVDDLGHIAAPAVLVVANTVKAARRAFLGVERAGIESALVIGRSRSIDREVEFDRWFRRVRSGRDRTFDHPPFVLVATQTIEVGVDIDVDSIVTEVAPIDSLIQRFGRVDRLGEVGDTTSYVLRIPSRLRGDPPPYGAASHATWEWLEGFVFEVGEASLKGIVRETAATFDFGSLAIRQRLDESTDTRLLRAPFALPPVVTAPAVECWRRTAPIPVPDESVASYLHGVGHGQESVSILWRADLPEGRAGMESFELHPAVQGHETVEVSISAARRFLAGESTGDRTDLEGEPPPASSERGTARPGAFVRRAEGWMMFSDLGRLRPGDFVAVPARFGGHDRWGFDGDVDVPDVRDPVIDVADLVVDESSSDTSRQVTLRLDREVLRAYVGRDLDETESESFAIAIDVEARSSSRRSAALDLLESVRAAPVSDARYRARFELLLDRLLRESARIESVPAGCVVRSSGRLASDASDEGPLSSSVNGETEVRLADHLRSVGERAVEFATSADLDDRFVHTVELAGRFHDLGKCDVRFQALLRGGPAWLAEGYGPDSSQLLAKSTEVAVGLASADRDSSGWPRGYRHEAVSLALVEGAADEVFDDVDRDLVEHLVASHHGHARPLFPPRPDESTAHTAVDFDGVHFDAATAGSHPGWSQPARFARVCERYGAWGVAYLESLIRLADISISEEGR